MKEQLSEKEKLQKQLNRIVKQEEKEMVEKHYPTFKKLVGKCFKARNSYGGGGRKNWWIYTKITEIKPEDVYRGADQILCHYKGYSFETDIYGAVNVQNQKSYVHGLGKEISGKEFNDEYEKMLLKIKEFKK